MSFYKAVSQPENMLSLPQPRKGVCLSVNKRGRGKHKHGGTMLVHVSQAMMFQKAYVCLLLLVIGSL